MPSDRPFRPHRGRSRGFGQGGGVAQKEWNPTPAQEKALKVFRLRGLWFHAWILSPERAKAMQLLVDLDLESLGVETQTARFERERAELYERLDPSSPKETT